MSKAKILFVGLFFLINPLTAEQDQKDHSKAQAEKKSERSFIDGNALFGLPEADENSYINKDKKLIKLTTTKEQRDELRVKFEEKFQKEIGMTHEEILKNRGLAAKRLTQFLKKEDFDKDTLYSVFGYLLVAHMFVTDAGILESDASLKADAPELKKHFEASIKVVVDKLNMHEIYLLSLSKDGHRDLSKSFEAAGEVVGEEVGKQFGEGLVEAAKMLFGNEDKSDKKEDK